MSQSESRLSDITAEARSRRAKERGNRTTPNPGAPDAITDHIHASGARRSEVALHYSSIHPMFLRRLAARHTGCPKGSTPLLVDGREYTGGDRGYGRGNWRRGMPLYDTLNHLYAHLQHWQESIESGQVPADDDLAGAAWGIEALMLMEQEYAQEMLQRAMAPNIGNQDTRLVEPTDGPMSKVPIARVVP